MDVGLFLTTGKNPQNELWYFNLNKEQDATTIPPAINYNPVTQKTTFRCNNIYDIKIKKNIAQYLHASAFSPNPSTWMKAIQSGFFTTWPGLDKQLVRKHLEKSIATAKGHMKQQRKNVRSTKPKHSKNEENIPVMPPIKTLDESNTETNEHFCKIIKAEDAGKAFCDLTGRYP
eukprot:476029-Ditylum_brightwellii.AAC.1